MRLVRSGTASLWALMLIVSWLIGAQLPHAVVADEGKHEHENESVSLSDEQVATAGIELEKAGPGMVRESLLLNGILQPNQEALVQVTPRFPGVVREVRKRVGDQVQKGDVLARVESNQSLTVYDLVAPIGGTIIDRQISLGEHVGEQKAAFVIADLSTVWVDFTVYQRDLSRVRGGETVIVDPEDGGESIDAKITYIAPVASSETQSGLARTVLKNPGMRLRPGLFVTGRLLLEPRPAKIIVKPTAFQMVENRTVVFVRVGDKFEIRKVETGSRDVTNVEVISGLQVGDVYAAKNSFIIKAEQGKSEARHAD